MKLDPTFLTSLPPVIRSNVPGSWAYDTMSRRILEEILPRIYQDNAAYSTALEPLKELEVSLRGGSSSTLIEIDDQVDDNQEWNRLVQSVQSAERNWLDAPWLISEFYFYRRVVAAFNYFHTKIDMFEPQKLGGLRDSLPYISQILPSVEEKIRGGNQHLALELAFFTSLWGNKLDLSLWPKLSSTTSALSNNKEGSITASHQLNEVRRFILDDHTDEVISYLLSIRPMTVHGTTFLDIIVDNAGYELVSDFILAHIILSLRIVSVVRFHTKKHPTFVSDATTVDCLFTIQFLQNIENDIPVQAFGQQLQDYHRRGQFLFLDDFFWCQPLPFWAMPDTIQERLQDSSLVIVKGDANYRRALGDRQWSFQTPAKDIFRYWPVSVCTLRTLKAEIACGITPIQQHMAEKEDPRWLVSGRWAVVQFLGRECC